MSQDPDEGGEKSHDPTQKKLDDARTRGEVPKSVDLTTAAAYGGFLLVLVAFAAGTLSSMGNAMANLIDRADSLSTIWFQDGGTTFSLGIFDPFMGPLAVWFGVPAGAALAALVGQRAVVVAPDRIQPKLNRISLIANTKNKFGREGLFEFMKSSVKLVVYSVILGIYLLKQMPEIVLTAQLSHAAALATMSRMVIGFFSIVLVTSALIGVVDLLWQQQQHLHKNRMSRKELTDEAKQTEGDPHVKQQRRQRAQEIAMNKMLTEVPGADVVVVNPQHYAVALKWSRRAGAAPICVAKGVDEIAARIREIAAESGVPVHRDPPTARALYATVDLGREIRPEHYRAVAAAIRFAESMRAKARRVRPR